jgi:hypothetical protein
VASTDSVRDVEREWLTQKLLRAGRSNQALADELQRLGWIGTVNNISNWKSGLAAIPDPVVPMLVRALGRNPEGEGLAEVVGFFSRRYPWLRPFLKEADAEGDKALQTPSSEAAMPVYWGREGAYKGMRFVPYVDGKGQYVAGRSRFKEDKVNFNTREELVEALKDDPELRVRMVPDGVRGAPPSLIHQRSLVWEHG